MKNISVQILVSLVLFAGINRADDEIPGFVPLLHIPIDWNMPGVGARALGLGGAFIAVANGATAISWNPFFPNISPNWCFMQRHTNTSP